ncbi:MAG: response regulator [Archangium sp.]|nr:response regulator [Archangium sp.]
MVAEARDEGGIDREDLLTVLSAVKRGDFSIRMKVRGTRANKQVAAALNDIISLNDQTATEFDRVATAVSKEGRVEVRAKVSRAPGSWASKVNSVNTLVGALAQQSDEMGRVIGAVAKGDLSKKLSLTVGDDALKGDFLRTARLVNGMVDQLSSFASEVTRVAREVGTEGKLGGQADVKGVGGTWKDLTDNVNSMATNLTTQVRNIAEVTTAVAKGDLSRKITVDVRGEILELKNTINTMVDQLNSFASEVTRVAREVGTEGKLGGQAVVKGVGGTWKDLTDNVNSMASNLTTQVRGIAKVVTHVANGDLKRKLVLDVKGEIAELADTINGLIDTLALFADQVTTVAREVGIEGKLGGQARVPGTAGLWRDLTDNVNQLAANLTTQVRAIAEVATAVTKGDLTRFVTVGAQGEVAALKDNINEMIRNLKDTTRKNTEQDWLKTNLTRFTRMLQGERDLATVSKVILSELAPLINAPYAAFYVAEHEGPQEFLRLRAGYAAGPEAGVGVTRVKTGVGLVGQCAADRQPIFVSNLPNDYARVGSGLGSAPATHLLVLPVLFEGELKAVLELGSFRPFSEVNVDFVKQLTQSIGIVLNTIGGNMRTETLLQQSQALTEELTEINKRLEQQKTEVEHKNREVGQAKAALEEKAEQLSLASKYKSEFLANMSHELRTPLNSLLLLSQYLSENADGNLSTKQVDFARTINSAGSELLELIDDILDLAKIESGTVAVNASPVRLLDINDFVERSFRQLAEKKNLIFRTELDPSLPPTLLTDPKRLQQVLRNLLSNAFKFTDKGSVVLKVFAAQDGFSHENASLLGGGGAVFGFSVTDTGIGIPREKHRLIFEAFQQADGTTSRRYGGTGLGLSISRELAQVLNGELSVQSEVGEGSTFTLFLPERFRSRQERSTPELLVPSPSPRLAVQRGEMPRTPFDSLRRAAAPVEPAGQSLLMVTEHPEDAVAARELAMAHRLRLQIIDHIDGIIEAARGPEIVALVVDLNLPGRDGSIALDRLKRDVSVRHLPVFMMGTPADEDRSRLLAGGAAGVMPSTPEGFAQLLSRVAKHSGESGRAVLVLDPRKDQLTGLRTMLAEPNTTVEVVQTLQEVHQRCTQTRYDCLVVALQDSDPSARAQLRSLTELALSPGQRPPVVFFTETGDPAEEWRWAMNPQANWVATFARTPERLLELVTRYLHRPLGAIPFGQQSLVRLALATDPQLAGRTVLVIDDDVRNIFALTAALEHHDIRVLHAESAPEGLKRLEENPSVDLVLMDVMMPEMDGYEATQAIRARKMWADLPVVALTAKAMKGDREKCLAAGASDYIAKPVNVDKLTSVLRVWLAPRAPAMASQGPVPTAEA